MSISCRVVVVLLLLMSAPCALAQEAGPAGTGTVALAEQPASQRAGNTVVPVAAHEAAHDGPVTSAPGPQDAAMPDAANHSAAASILPDSFSPWDMFMHAGVVVKAVIVGLAFASLVTWTLFLVKGLELWRRLRRSRALRHALNSCVSLDDARRTGPGGSAEMACVDKELQWSKACLADGEGLKERMASGLDEITLARARAATNGVGILATIGNTAPFVGLFGTVWGIMHSFIGISQAHTTNLSVVAPGIAEALLTTALGLVAAIPAVIIYNLFVRRINVYKAVQGDVAASLLRLLSRDLSRQKTDSDAALRLALRATVEES